MKTKKRNEPKTFQEMKPFIDREGKVERQITVAGEETTITVPVRVLDAKRAYGHTKFLVQPKDSNNTEWVNKIEFDD